jgi:hypothetical protein
MQRRLCDTQRSFDGSQQISGWLSAIGQLSSGAAKHDTAGTAPAEGAAIAHNNKHPQVSASPLRISNAIQRSQFCCCMLFQLRLTHRQARLMVLLCSPNPGGFRATHTLLQATRNPE